ncbi:hypothetical protein CCUS01_08985 [Colletotrichum cuscutae]|uniref:NodB homology domain-containing protein n=1 Tax=Colletotrichum cuscutae TaxID=1209917 RepID=A0AAI9XUD3_9PEZI|nr:hypothetical protein CCUS01_08985 [Colletotrichum cuscutae]
MEYVVEIGGVRVRIRPVDENPKTAVAFQDLVGQLQLTTALARIPRPIPEARRRVQVLVSVDFDAVSGWMGTGQHPNNCLADFSSGIFAGRVGVGRLLGLFNRIVVSDKIALHGYCHEDCTKLDTKQEEVVLDKCIALAESLTGKRPVGFRAPLYRIRHETISLLEKRGFLYDTSLSGHDSRLYPLDRGFSLTPVDYSKPAHTWMQPSVQPQSTGIIEIPANWYVEDMTPLQFWPNVENSHGFVSVQTIEKMWKDRFTWLWSHGADGNGPGDFVFPSVLHPDTSGMAHIAGAIEDVLFWLKSWGSQVEFVTYETAARSYVEQKGN